MGGADMLHYRYECPACGAGGAHPSDSPPPKCQVCPGNSVTMKRVDGANACRARHNSDQVTCDCGNVWDMNDPCPPACPGSAPSAVTLSAEDAHFLAVRLRRLCAHLNYALPKFAAADASLVNIAGTVIGALLTNLTHGAQGVLAGAAEAPAPEPSCAALEQSYPGVRWCYRCGEGVIPGTCRAPRAARVKASQTQSVAAALRQARFAMEMEHWNWRSEASTDMKREAHRAVCAALDGAMGTPADQPKGGA